MTRRTGGCSVPGCESVATKKRGCEVTLHHLPAKRSQQVEEAWRRFCSGNAGGDHSGEELGEGSSDERELLICSRHFAAKCYYTVRDTRRSAAGSDEVFYFSRLRTDAVPSIPPPGGFTAGRSFRNISTQTCHSDSASAQLAKDVEEHGEWTVGGITITRAGAQPAGLLTQPAQADGSAPRSLAEMAPSASGFTVKKNDSVSSSGTTSSSSQGSQKAHDSTFTLSDEELAELDLEHFEDESLLEDHLDDDGFALVHRGKLRELTRFCMEVLDGKPCALPVISVEKRSQGTALMWTMECQAGHCKTWESQPRVPKRKVFLGNILLVAATIFAGLGWEKMSEFFDLFGILRISKATFYNKASTIIHKGIMHCYEKHEEAVHSELRKRDQELVLAGDGRYDSPGKNATFCCYSLQDVFTGLIATFTIKDRRAEKCSSTMLERIACKAALLRMQAVKGILAFCSDRSPTIRTLLREAPFSTILHQFDPWHFAKNFKKKLQKLSQQKGMKALQVWVSHIVNHLWFAASACKGDWKMMQNLWKSMLLHITNKHHWIDEGGEESKCLHEHIDDEGRVPWLMEGTPAHTALSALVLDKKLLKDMRHLSLFIHTSSLENFHSLILKYAPKRIFFDMDALQARMALATMDHNFSFCREVVGITEVHKKTTGRSGVRLIKKRKSNEWKFEVINYCLVLSMGPSEIPN